MIRIIAGVVALVAGLALFVSTPQTLSPPVMAGAWFALGAGIVLLLDVLIDFVDPPGPRSNPPRNERNR